MNLSRRLIGSGIEEKHFIEKALIGVVHAVTFAGVVCRCGRGCGCGRGGRCGRGDFGEFEAVDYLCKNKLIFTCESNFCFNTSLISKETNSHSEIARGKCNRLGKVLKNTEKCLNHPGCFF